MNSSSLRRFAICILTPLMLAPSLSAASDTSLWAMIQQGGWAMYPLALCSLALIYLIVHCLRGTKAKDFGDPTLAQRVAELCQIGQRDQALQAARSHISALGSALSSALPKFHPTKPETSLEAFNNEVADSLDLAENGIAQWIHYLSVIANVSPMIGLLGTVSGMIGGFQTMSAGGMGRPELFAGDIGEALITTAAGLCIGIPAMIAHSYFSNRLNTLMVETNRHAGLVADALSQSSLDTESTPSGV